jgi:hypothetical protein
MTTGLLAATSHLERKHPPSIRFKNVRLARIHIIKYRRALAVYRELYETNTALEDVKKALPTLGASPATGV